MIDIQVTGSAAARFSRRDVAAFTRRVLAARDRVDDLREVSIAFVDDATMETLNRKFRRKHRTTDVLTFPGADSCEIVISVDQAKRQAVAEKHSLPTEIRYLLLHGILHGLGYDHATDHGEMNALELKVRERVNLD